MGLPKEKFDDRLIRCRRLGHEVPFKYCRSLEGKTVCPSIRNCWWERLDIDTWLTENLSEKEHEKLAVNTPPQKISSIMDIINSVKQHVPPPSDPSDPSD